MTSNQEKNEDQIEKPGNGCTKTEAIKPSLNESALNETESLKKELSEWKDKYLRALAESENARKRLQKEKQETIQYALQEVIIDFLTPIDQMENALKFIGQMSPEVKNWAIGFQMILEQFHQVLSENGVSKFSSEGKPFDPNLHEAVETVETTDFPAGIIIEENLHGYTMGERTIRPARVKVSKRPCEQAKSSSQTNETNKEE